jgi:hypothetical protein
MSPFFEIDLRGSVLQCVIGRPGPMVIGDGAGVCLGVCAMRNLGDMDWTKRGPLKDTEEVGQPSWCIVKYEHERCIELPWGATFDEARELAELLGIVMWRPLLHPRVRAEAFYASSAFEALCGWVAEHPKVAARYAKDQTSRDYLPDWYERVLSKTTTAPTSSGRHLPRH